MLVQFNWW